MPSVSGSVLFSSTSFISGATGVSNIPIVIQNTTTNTGAVVLTDATGNYQFNNVANGSYRIVESYQATGGTVSPKDFSTAMVMVAPIPKDPDILAIANLPANTTKITSLTPNTIFITVSGSNITGQNFIDMPQRNIPITINDMVLIDTNLVTAADNGTFGSNPVGTAANSSPVTTPYASVVTGFTYFQYSLANLSDGRYFLPNIAAFMTSSDSWLNYSDHTTGDETGRFQFVGGSTTGALLFTQTLSNVKANAFYMLSVWIGNLCKLGKNLALPSLGVRLKATDSTIIFNKTLDNIAEPAIPTWNQVATVLNTGSNTTVILEIYSNGPSASGNDYVVDDILLQECTVNTNLITTSEFVDKGYADVGDVLTYTTVIRNNGSSITNNITIRDSLPSSTSFVTGSITVNGTTMPSATFIPSGYNTTQSLSPAGVLTVSYKVLVNTLPSTSVISNKGVTKFDFLPVSGGATVTPTINSNVVTTSINYGSIYTVETSNKTNVGLGDTLIYILSMKNIGSTVVRNVIVTGTIPDGTTFISNSLDNNGTNITGAMPTLFNVGTIEVNELHTITYKVQTTTIPSIPTITNSATVTFNYIVDPSIPVGKNASINTAIITNYIKYPNLSITKSINKQYFIPGEIATYTILVNNTGSVTAKNVILQDTIPDENTFVTNSVYINGTLTVANPSYLNIGNIAVGGKSTVTFKVQVNN